MIAQQLTKPFQTFALHNTDFILSQEQYEAEANYLRGFDAFETLPATYYNSILQALTIQANSTYQMVKSLWEELSNAIVTPDPATNTQLKELLDTLATPVAATSEALGTIKLGFVSTDTQKAINLNAENRAYADIGLAGSGQTGLVKSSSLPWTVSYHSSNSGIGTVNVVNATSTASGLMSSVEKNRLAGLGLKLSDSTLYLVFDGSGSSSIELPSTTHAISATYLRPANSTSTKVTADSDGNITGHSLTLT